MELLLFSLLSYWTYSLTMHWVPPHTLTYSVTLSHTYLLSHSHTPLMHTLMQFHHSPRILTQSILTHSFTHTLIESLARLMLHWIPHSLTASLTRSLHAFPQKRGQTDLGEDSLSRHVSLHGQPALRGALNAKSAGLRFKPCNRDIQQQQQSIFAQNSWPYTLLWELDREHSGQGSYSFPCRTFYSLGWTALNSTWIHDGWQALLKLLCVNTRIKHFYRCAVG